MNVTKKINNSKSRKCYINKLKKIYPSCEFDKGNNKSLYKHDITYGEMEYKGMKKLYNYVNKINKNINCFIDIGSGRGKLCMYLASSPKINDVVGIELVTERHNDATKLKLKLDEEYSKKITLIHEDINNIDLSIYKNKQAFVFFSNLCMPPLFINTIFKKLQNELSSGSIICCSISPTIKIGTLLDNIDVEMSWASTSNIYIYQL